MRHHLVFIAAFVAFLCHSTNGSEDSLDGFLAWLGEQGATLHVKLGVGIDKATNLRGLLVGEPVVAGTTLLTLPRGLILTAGKVREQGFAWQRCAADTRNETDDFLSPMHTAFAMFLLEQRNVGEYWHPWVSMMPSSLHAFPLFWSEEELAELQASPLRRWIQMDRDSTTQDYTLALRQMPAVTLHDFRWARTSVKSRIFNLRTLSKVALKEDLFAMAPLADFVNHPPDGLAVANAKPEYDAESGSLRFVAVRDVSADSGVYWEYGFQSNRDSLLRYGFTSKQRIPLTTMPMFLRLTDLAGSVESAKKLRWTLIEELRATGALVIDPDGSVLHELSLSLSGPDAERLLAHLRFMVLQPKSEEFLRTVCGDTYCQPLNLRNERQALALLAKMLDDMITSYDTSANEDQVSIDDGLVKPQDGAKWDALLIRYGEKKILAGMKRVLEALDPLFDLSPSALTRVAGERWSRPQSDIDQYVHLNITKLVEEEARRRAKRKAAKTRADKDSDAKH